MVNDIIYSERCGIEFYLRDYINNDDNWLMFTPIASYAYKNDTKFKTYVNNYINIKKLKLCIDADISDTNDLENVNSLFIRDCNSNINICNFKLLESIYLVRCKITNIQNLPLLNALFLNECDNMVNKINNLTSISVLGLFLVKNTINIGYFMNLQILYVGYISKKYVYGLFLLKKLNTIYRSMYLVKNKSLKNQEKKLNKINNNIENRCYHNHCDFTIMKLLYNNTI